MEEKNLNLISKCVDKNIEEKLNTWGNNTAKYSLGERRTIEPAEDLLETVQRTNEYMSKLGYNTHRILSSTSDEYGSTKIKSTDPGSIVIPQLNGFDQNLATSSSDNSGSGGSKPRLTVDYCEDVIFPRQNTGDNTDTTHIDVNTLQLKSASTTVSSQYPLSPQYPVHHSYNTSSSDSSTKAANYNSQNSHPESEVSADALRQTCTLLYPPVNRPGDSGNGSVHRLRAHIPRKSVSGSTSLNSAMTNTTAIINMKTARSIKSETQI